VLFSGQTLKNGFGPPIPRFWYTEQIAKDKTETPIFTVELSEKEVKRFDLVNTFLERINFHVRRDRNYQTQFKTDEYVGTVPSSFLSRL
jgi:hypothetical protein